MAQDVANEVLSSDRLDRMIGHDLAALLDPGTLQACLDEAMHSDIGVTAGELAVARALLHRISGSALLNGDKQAVGDAAVLYRMVAAANSLLIGRISTTATAGEATLKGLCADGQRYRWLRPRLRVRPMQSVSGAVRSAIDVRVGQSFFDTPTRGGRGYVDPAVFDAECVDLDTEIDGAFAIPPMGPLVP